ncbi:hypothetical protein [Mesorhizobium sp. M1342]|uniref:hypothetical protein n=1 Tax=Mesorhizobium sp. M1342 TaxID=2957088 RepID=UPI00333AD1EE
MSQLTSLWHYLSLSPNFVPAVVGVAASFAGAWGAQVAILRRDQRREVLASVRAVNEALALSYAIGNNFLSLKNQHVKGMLERFREAESSVQAQLQRIFASPPSDKIVPIQTAMELQTMPISKVPIDRLETVVFEKLSVNTKTLNIVIEVNKAIDALSSSLKIRNDLIQKWKDEGLTVSEFERTVRYFGFHTEKGADETYKQNLHAIGKYCDDCIYFTTRLDEALNEHGKRIRRNRYRLFNPLPKLVEADFSSERAQRLMPDPKEYEDWESGFVMQPTFRDKLAKMVSRKKKPVTSSQNP